MTCSFVCFFSPIFFLGPPKKHIAKRIHKTWIPRPIFSAPLARRALVWKKRLVDVYTMWKALGQQWEILLHVYNIYIYPGYPYVAIPYLLQ